MAGRSFNITNARKVNIYDIILIKNYDYFSFNSLNSECLRLARIRKTLKVKHFKLIKKLKTKMHISSS